MKKSRILFLLTSACIIISVLLSGCAGDVTVLSPEEEKEWMKEQTELFSDVNLSDFNVETIDGKTITAEDCFEDYTLTMVNIWGTFCGPCVDEMPEISKLYNSRPKDVNIISICVDAGESDKNLDFANKVMNKTEAGFSTLIPDKTLKRALTDRVTSFPTTIFVDSNGKIVGTPYFGTLDESGYRTTIEDMLQLMSGSTNIKEQNS